MALEELDLDGMETELPAEAAAVIDEANRRIDELFESEQNRKYPRYLPSDPAPFYSALAHLTAKDIPLGKVFCEWGSGFGVHSCLAALLGYEAYAIEIEPDLADLADKLAESLKLNVETLCTSYVPEGFESYAGVDGDVLIRPEEMTYNDRDSSVEFEPSYEGMPHTAAEVDVYFMYPHPSDQDFMISLFEAIAVEGAILVAYYAQGDIHAYRKADGGDDIW